MTYFDEFVLGPLKGTSFFYDSNSNVIYIRSSADNMEILKRSNESVIQSRDITFGVDLNTIKLCGNEVYKIDVIWFFYNYGRDLYNNIRRLEYSSTSLVNYMCWYKNDKKDELLEKIFNISDIKVGFSGHNAYSEVQNIDYEPFDPCVYIEFYEDKSIIDAYKYIRVIDDVIKLFTFQSEVTIPKIRLSDYDRNNEFILYIMDKKYSRNEFYNFQNLLKNTMDVIPIVFEKLLNEELNSNYYIYYYLSNDLTKLFMDTYSVFDRLSSAKYSHVEGQDEGFVEFKKKIWDYIRKDEEYYKYKDNISNLRDKILSHGNVYGHKQKLSIAYNDMIKLIPSRADSYDMKDDRIVSRIYEIRTEITHKGEVRKFESIDYSSLEKLQWITYLLQLKHLGVTEGYEELLDSVFGVG